MKRPRQQMCNHSIQDGYCISPEVHFVTVQRKPRNPRVPEHAAMYCLEMNTAWIKQGGISRSYNTVDISITKTQFCVLFC